MCIVVIVYGALLGPLATWAMITGWVVGNVQSYAIVEPMQVFVQSLCPSLFAEESRLSRCFMYIYSWLQFLGFPV